VLTVVAIAGVLIVAVLIACLVPASRAATIDPSSALRHI
jgi:ABC-type lipoprotein release transport system permease subunit